MIEADFPNLVVNFANMVGNLSSTIPCHFYKQSGNIYQFIGFNWCDILMLNVDILPNILLVSKIITTQMAIFATHVGMFAQMWSKNL